MTNVIVEFDGKSFVPQQPVNLPIGTRATIAIPDAVSIRPSPPAAPLEDPEWTEIVAQIRAGEPDPPTVEEAMRQMRMRP